MQHVVSIDETGTDLRMPRCALQDSTERDDLRAGRPVDRAIRDEALQFLARLSRPAWRTHLDAVVDRLLDAETLDARHDDCSLVDVLAALSASVDGRSLVTSVAPELFALPA